MGLGLTEAGLTSLLSKVSLKAQGPVDYSMFLERVKAQLSRAATLQEAQAEVAAALRGLMERGGDGKHWLVRCFQIVDREVNGGKANGRMGQDALFKWLLSVRVALSHRLAADMVKIANAAGENREVTYADFLRMLGESGSQLRNRGGGAGNTAESVDALSEEMEEEIREVVKGKYETLTNAFRSFDKDNSGSISRDEMLQGLKRLGLPLTERQFANIIKRADVDGGGSIDLQEFRFAFETGGRADTKRQEHASKQQRQLLLQQKAEMREKEASAASEAQKLERLQLEVVPPVDEDVESQFWGTLQQHCAGICEAFALIKKKGAQSASQGALQAADSELMSEAEFSEGLRHVFDHNVSRHAKPLFLRIVLAGVSKHLEVTELLRASEHVEMVQFLRAHSRWHSRSGSHNVVSKPSADDAESVTSLHAPPRAGTGRGATSEAPGAREEQKRDEILRRVQEQREQHFAWRRDEKKAKSKKQEGKMEKLVSHAAQLWNVRSVDEEERHYRERRRAKERVEQRKKLDEDKRSSWALQQETRSTGVSFTHTLTRPARAQGVKICRICRKMCGIYKHASQWREEEDQTSKAALQAGLLMPPPVDQAREEERIRNRQRLKDRLEEKHRKFEEKKRKVREAQLLAAGRHESFPP